MKILVQNLANQIIGLQRRLPNLYRSRGTGGFGDGNGVYLVPKSRRLKGNDNSGDENGKICFLYCAIQLKQLWQRPCAVTHNFFYLLQAYLVTIAMNRILSDEQHPLTWLLTTTDPLCLWCTSPLLRTGKVGIEIWELCTRKTRFAYAT